MLRDYLTGKPPYYDFGIPKHELTKCNLFTNLTIVDPRTQNTKGDLDILLVNSSNELVLCIEVKYSTRGFRCANKQQIRHRTFLYAGLIYLPNGTRITRPNKRYISWVQWGFKRHKNKMVIKYKKF